MSKTTSGEDFRDRVAFWFFVPLLFVFALCLAVSVGWSVLQWSGLVGPSIYDFQHYVQAQIEANHRALAVGSVTSDEAGKRDAALRGSLRMVD